MQEQQFKIAAKISALFLCLASINARAADVPQSFTLDGQLFRDAAATSALQDNSIDFKVQVLDEAKVCVIYEETQNLSTITSNGYFSVQVGTEIGSIKRTSGDSANSMATVFQNISAINGKLLSNGSPCVVAPVAAKRRYVRITIAPATMGSTARVLSPDLSIDSVPNAVVAERAENLQGVRASQVLQVNTAAGAALSQANLESLFTSTTRFNSLTSVIDGTSTNYMRSNSASGAQLPVLAGAPTAPPIGAIWFDSSDSKLKFQTSLGPATLGTGAGSVTSVGFTAPAELSVTGAPITSSGTIAVTWAAQTTGKVFASPNGSTGTPTFRSLVAADVPFAVQNLGGTPSLQSGLDTAKGAATTAGRIWISTDTKEIYRDNGTTWDSLGPVGAGGPPSGAASGDLSGTYPGPTVAKIQGVAVGVTAPTDGQVLKYIGGGTAAWTPSSFSIGDLKTSIGAQQFAGSSTCTAAQTLTWSSLTDTFTCANIAGLDGAAITTGTVAAARLPDSASAWTVSGSDIYRSSGNVGLGTATPTGPLEVQGGAAAAGAGAPITLRGQDSIMSGGSSFNGGNIAMTAGNGYLAGAGGSVGLTAGRGNFTSGASGFGASLSLSGSPNGGQTGSVLLSGGNGNNGYGNSGQLSIGSSTGAGSGGSVTIGGSSSTNGGDVSILGGVKSGAGTDGNVLLATAYGNVGIGTMTPSEALEVVGTVKATDFVTTSDRRAKRDIAAIPDALERIMQINGVSWNWISTGEPDLGVIAQDVEQVFPELVVTDAKGRKAVKYGNLVGPLIEAVKTLKTENDILKSRNEELEARLNRLEMRLDAAAEEAKSPR